MHYWFDATIISMQKVPRLLKYFTITNYKLNLSLNRTKRLFEGVVTMSGVANSDENFIRLHAKDLSIKSVTVNNATVEFIYDEFDELKLKIKVEKENKYLIVINYSGLINDSMHGMYPCYFEHNGVKKELLATQFESHHAREVFPCIDEPAAKATYDVTLITERGVTVLGNMPVKDSLEIDNNLLETSFETTPIMSSYLLAWVVGEMHKKTAFTKNGVEVNIWATPNQSLDSLDFALDISTRTIDFFNDYFGTSYPFKKCDQVALPDFSSGAMENWGLITYREVALLADPKTSSTSDKHYIATVIAHELSHQWFGNLVTMKWWNDLWLNESFASLIEYVAVNAIEPTWNVWQDFASFDSIIALRRDSVAGVQSVQTEVNHPDEINTLFDGAIVYSKGARLIQMLQKYIGDENFKLGLQNYFKKYAYKNTVAEDLWDELSIVSGLNIASFMNKWISQSGYPVLHVELIDNKLTLSQNRLASPRADKDNTLWPIVLNSNNNKIPKILNTKSSTFKLDELTNIRFNVGSYSHFITHYPHQILQSIISDLEKGILTPIARLQILNEQSILANAGIISNAELVVLLNSYTEETVESVWSIIGSTIGNLKKYVDDNKEAEEKLRSLAEKLVNKQYTLLGWTKKDNEQDVDTKLRSIILGLMLYSENKDATKIANKIYANSNITELDAEIRSLILSNFVKYESSLSKIIPLMDTYKKTESSSLRQDICAGLTSTRSLDIAKYILDKVKDPEIIRPQDASRWVIYLLRNKYTKSIVWKWLQNNWDWIEKTFEGDKSYDDFPRYAASALSTKAELKEFKEFFTPMLDTPSLSRVIEMGINEITDRLDSIERDSTAVCEALLSL